MLIVTLIAAAVLMGILSPVLQGYFDKIQEETPITPDDVVRHPIKSLEKLLIFFTDFLKQNSDMVSLRMLYLGIFVVISRFLIYLPMFPVTKILHEKMTSGFDVGLINAFLSTLKQNLLLNLVLSVAIGIVDILLFVASIYMTLGLFRLIGIISLPISLLIILSVYSLRMTAVCQILPEYFMNKPKPMFKAVPLGFKTAFKQFTKNFICIFVMLIIYFSIIVTTFVPTLGLVPILLVPTIMVIQSALYLILNYTYKRHKYFTDNGVTVYNPVKKY